VIDFIDNLWLGFVTLKVGSDAVLMMKYDRSSTALDLYKILACLDLQSRGLMEKLKVKDELNKSMRRQHVFSLME
jgi:hypothetical protein